MTNRLALLVALSIWIASVGCGPQGLTQTPQTRSSEPSPLDKTYDVSCDDAFRYALRAMKTRGLVISAVERSATGGTLVGSSDAVSGHRVTITCGTAGVRMDASGGGEWPDQGLKLSFSNVVDQGDRIWPPPKGPRAFVETLSGPESRVYFSTNLESLGMTAVRIRFVNGGDRAIRLVPSRIRANPAGGGGRDAIAVASVRSKLPAGDHGKILESTTVAPGKEVLGFVFFPAGSYETATIVMIDEPTGEADEIDISL